MVHYVLTKDSQKHIKSILKNNLLLNNFVKFNNNISQSLFLNNTLKIINNVCDTKNTFTHIQQKKYKPSTKINTPLMYELFKNAYYDNILDMITKKLNDTQKIKLSNIIKNENVTDFNIFFNQYQHLFRYGKLNDYVFEYPDNQTAITFSFMYSYGPISELLYDNPFMPIDVQYDAEHNILDYDKYVSHDGSTIHLYTYSHEKHNVDIDMLFNIIRIMQKIAKSDKSVKLIIFNSNKQKKINELIKSDCNCKHLAPTNINTGSTLPSQYVKIWRNEEIYKVLIHELVHFFGIDMNFHRSQVAECDAEIKQIFNITSDSVDYVNESYTEIVALLIHTSYVSYVSKVDLFLLLWLEMSFTILQIAKIISYYDLGNSHCVIKNIPGCNKKNISQSTSVLSYFIIKGCVFYNLSDILKFIDKDVMFGKREIEYMKIIKKSLGNQKFYNDIDVHIKNMSSYDFMNNSLRMTCLQIK